MRSTPTAGMEVTLGMLPLPLYAEESAVKTRLRTRDLLTDTWDGIGHTRKGHRKLADEILNKMQASNMPSDVIQRTRQWADMDDVQDPDVIVYTDGSRMDEGSGAGWAVCHGDEVIAEESTYLGKRASVFQSEAVAIERALQWCTQNLDSGTNIVIRSDSQSVIMALENEITTSRVIYSCKTVLRKARENLRIAMRWIKGHADFTGNELADYLARLGSCRMVHSTEPELPVPGSHIIQEIKDHFQAKWQKNVGQESNLLPDKNLFTQSEQV